MNFYKNATGMLSYSSKLMEKQVLIIFQGIVPARAAILELYMIETANILNVLFAKQDFAGFAFK